MMPLWAGLDWVRSLGLTTEQQRELVEYPESL